VPIATSLVCREDRVGVFGQEKSARQCYGSEPGGAAFRPSVENDSYEVCSPLSVMLLLDLTC